MSELKKCPFCGGKAVASTFFDWDDLEHMPIEVNDCDAEVTCENERCINGWYLPPEAWNTRPIEDALNTRIAELEGKIDQLTAHSDIERKVLIARIAKLEGFIDRLIEVGDWLNAMHEDGVFVDELNAARTSWKLAVSDWQAMPFHVTNHLDSQGIVTRNGGEG